MSAGIENLNRALAAGDLGTLRATLASLDEGERALLEAEFGGLGFRRLSRASRGRRRATLGRVIVINGIMGSLLDAVKNNDADRVWVNLWRLGWGRIADLKLKRDGAPADPKVRVAVAGLHKTYLPLLLEIDNRWDVHPFAFDWRHDIDRSAERLAELVRTWGQGEPVHIVAHSMGGLVSRRMIQMFPDVWERMDDRDQHQRGGRLVMLGTPNHGSYTIPLALTGEEKAVRMLEILDLTHNRQELLAILGTFIGSYQMLPSPLIDSDDDHVTLFEPATWGKLPVHRELLDNAHAFQSNLATVIDTERFIYVAGYDQPTPYRVRVDGPGKFKYQYTQDGDGRVPHALGLLDGVTTYWVDEGHGDLPKNESVLDGIDMLLSSGATDTLASQRPERRGVAEPTEWLTGEELEPLPPEFKEAKRARRPKTEPATSSELIEQESAILGDYLGRPSTRGSRVDAVDGSGGARASRGPIEIDIEVEVVWGDIRHVTGDVYCVGHYQNVLPQNAEWALDLVVSGCDADAPKESLVLTDLTRRGVLVGALGEINFYPWSKKWAKRNDRLVAVAGMGHAGEFDGVKLRRLARNLAASVVALPDAETVCTVLIGAGEGGLPTRTAVRFMLLGLADALAEGGQKTSIKKLRFVEYSYSRASKILHELERLTQQSGIALPGLNKSLGEGGGGRVDTPHGLALALAAAADAFHRRSNSAAHRGVDSVLEKGLPEERLEAARNALSALEIVEEIGVQPLAGRLHVHFDDRCETTESDPLAQPTRISYAREKQGISVSAITNSSTVPIRDLRGDFALVREIIERATDPDPADAPDIADLLDMTVVHSAFRDLLAGSSPLIFDVDRAMATVHWEFLPGDRKAIDGMFVSLQRAVARQLRTRHSPPALSARRSASDVRALVIGDPGDPDENANLPGARREAREVAKLLRERGCDVMELIGAPARTGRGPVSGVPAASRLEVLKHLVRGEFDLVHYCGHGDFDCEDPTRVGWVFKGGLITPAEIESMERAPRVIVANACLSGRTSATFAGRGSNVREQNLLPSLADEFFHRGVRNYIGTAWEINDEGAVIFARTLYETLFAGGAQNAIQLGHALLAARRALFAQEDRYDCLWAAYQHYGDPQLKL